MKRMSRGEAETAEFDYLRQHMKVKRRKTYFLFILHALHGEKSVSIKLSPPRVYV